MNAAGASAGSITCASGAIRCNGAGDRSQADGWEDAQQHIRAGAGGARMQIHGVYFREASMISR